MPDPDFNPTPYPDVNEILGELLSGARAILGDRFAGMYLYGSLALGDFNPRCSDIDFLIATAEELPEDVVHALQTLHARIAASDSRWAIELEGSYIWRDALRRYDPAATLHPHIGRGGGGLVVEEHASDGVVQRHVLREHGITLAGPDPRTLIDPIHPDELRRAQVNLMREWWVPMCANPVLLRHGGYQVYAVLTMCRVLYTMEHGAIVSKAHAARWALETLDDEFRGLIERAAAWQGEQVESEVEGTVRLIRYSWTRCEQWERSAGAAPSDSTFDNPPPPRL